MAKKIIITKKPTKKIKKPNKKGVKKDINTIKPKIKFPPIKTSPPQKKVISKKNKTKPIIKKTIKQPTPKNTTSQKVIISKVKTKKSIKSQPTKIKIKDQPQQEHWFKKILQSIRNTIIFILPLILIILTLWFVITNFFPDVAAKIGPVFKVIWKNTKDFVQSINEHGTDFIKWLGLPSKSASTIFSGIAIAVGLILGLACCGIPVIGPFVGGAILIATAIYTGITWWDNQTTSKEDSPPKALVEVRDLNDQKREEEKLKQELKEYATKLSQEGKSEAEIKQKLNERIEEQKDLQKKKKQTNQLN